MSRRRRRRRGKERGLAEGREGEGLMMVYNY